MNRIEPQQLAGCYDACGRALTLYARQWLPCAAAEDVVQTAFLKLLDQGCAPRDAKAWLFRTVRNAAVNELRKASRRRRHDLAIASGRAGWFEPDGADHLDAQAAQRALELLPPAQRELVVMRIWGELTLAEMAGVLGVAVSTVYAQYKAALETLRQRMGKP